MRALIEACSRERHWLIDVEPPVIPAWYRRRLKKMGKKTR